MSETEVKPTQAEEAPAPVAVESKEPSGDVAVSRPGAVVFTILAFCMLVLFVVATPIEWFDGRTAGKATITEVGIFSTTTTTASAVTTMYVADIQCDELRQRFRAIEAFAVISILLSAAAFFVGINATVNKTKLTVPLVLGVAVMITSLIAWGMGARLYYQSGICGASSLATQLLEVGPGLALFVTGWCFSFVAIFVAFKDPVLPAVLPEALIDSVGAYIYSVFAFAAFVFLVIGTPVQIVHLWLNATTQIRATMWKINVWNAVTDVTTKYNFDELGLILGTACPEIERFAKVAQAFAIMAIVLSLFALVSGILFAVRKIGKAIPMILGTVSALFALISVAHCAVIYYRRFCAGAPSLEALGFRLDAGVALFVSAVLLLAVGSIILAIIALVQHIGSGAKGGNVKPTAFLFIFGAVISTFFLVLGASQPVMVKNVDANNYVRFSFWKKYVLDGGVYSTFELTCTGLSTRLNGAGVLDVIAIFFSVLAVILGIAQLIGASLRKAASAVLLFGSLIQLTSWGLGVAAFTGTWCNQEYYVANYDIGVGLGLIIASWCLSVVVAVLNLIVEA